mgnify:CR=1 FL=1
MITISVSVSHNGATAEERKNSQQDEFKGTNVRSHGHPIANLSDSIQSNFKANTNAYINNDDEASEIEWQKMNKAADVAEKKSVGKAKVIGSVASNPITFHAGGPIGLYTGPTQVIPVWVGNWEASRKANWNSILRNLVSSIGGSGSISAPQNIFNTNSLYFSLKGIGETQLTWPSISPTNSLVANLKSASGGIVPVSDADVATYINRALSTGVVTAPQTGTKAIYVYLGANNTRLSSGFGTAYCGWHTYGTLGSRNIPYIAIQDFQSKYLSSCAAQTISPNGDAQLDAMASVLVHEIDEVITDPDIRTWYDSRGAENADKCAWTFGISSMFAGAKYNYVANNVKYYIQRNWLANNLVTDSVAGTACVITNN